MQSSSSEVWLLLLVSDSEPSSTFASATLLQGVKWRVTPRALGRAPFLCMPFLFSCSGSGQLEWESFHFHLLSLLILGKFSKDVRAHLFGFSLELSQLILRQRQEVVIVFWVLLPAHGLQQPGKAQLFSA